MPLLPEGLEDVSGDRLSTPGAPGRAHRDVARFTVGVALVNDERLGLHLGSLGAFRLAQRWVGGDGGATGERFRIDERVAASVSGQRDIRYDATCVLRAEEVQLVVVLSPAKVAVLDRHVRLVDNGRLAVVATDCEQLRRG
jgi:hypothetical protein